MSQMRRDGRPGLGRELGGGTEKEAERKQAKWQKLFHSDIIK